MQNPPPSSNFEDIPLRSLIVDYEYGTIRIEHLDGRTRAALLPDSMDPGSRVIAAIELQLVDGRLRLKTMNGELVCLDLPVGTPESSIPARPIVYLDQNHWSTLAKARFRPDRVQIPAELEAARSLIDRALRREICLPFSSAHALETTKWTNAGERRELGLTILELSRGWQLLHPLEIRRIELRNALDPTSSPREVRAFSLSRDALYGEVSAPVLPQPDGASSLVAFAVGGCALAELLLDDEPIEPGVIDGWVDGMRQASAYLAMNARTPTERVSAVNALFERDIMPDISSVAQAEGLVGDSRLGAFLSRVEAEVPRMPATGLYREVFRERLSNPGRAWSANDLVDIVYLSSAAGYADYIVAERSTASAIRNGLRRLGRSDSKVCSNLRSFVGVLAAN
ncbi:MAG: hypothetical protein WD942_03565 [Dehalococcoidia bacterium]